VNEYLADARADPFVGAWFAYAEGRFPAAAEGYERALRRGRDRCRSRLRADLGRIHFLAGNHARAVEHLAQAVADLRARDERELVYVYESKALLEHSAGVAHEEAGNLAAAREAYGRALQEDLAFHPAHVRLGWLALAAGDTAAAVGELELAAQAAPGDPGVLYEHALVLVAARRYPEAMAQLLVSAAREPFFAPPHLVMAKMHDASGMREEALRNYTDFAARAAADDPERAAALARIAALDAELKAQP
jgi:tetratricopeptide (TPR) repeat protein